MKTISEYSKSPIHPRIFLKKGLCHFAVFTEFYTLVSQWLILKTSAMIQQGQCQCKLRSFPPRIYLFKGNSRNTRKFVKSLRSKQLKKHHDVTDIFLVSFFNFEEVSNINLEILFFDLEHVMDVWVTSLLLKVWR